MVAASPQTAETPDIRIPTSRTKLKEITSRPTTRRSPSNEKRGVATSSPKKSGMTRRSMNKIRLSPSTRKAEDCSGLGANYHVVTMTGPPATDENRLSTPSPTAIEHVPMTCPGPLAPTTGPGPLASTTGPGPLESTTGLGTHENFPTLPTPLVAEGDLNLFLATLSYVGPAPAPTNGLSLTTSGSVTYPSDLLHSPATYSMGPTTSVTGLSCPWPRPPHRCACHVSLVLIEEPRVPS